MARGERDFGGQAGRPQDTGLAACSRYPFWVMTRLSRLALAVGAALLLAACSPAAEAPVSFDPNAPSITANGQKFDKAELDVPADSGFELVLHNQDSVPHNVSIYSDEGRTQRIFGADLANTGTHVYHVQALAPGTYYFQCDVHPAMNGTVVAAAG
jgi:plastocyanin